MNLRPYPFVRIVLPLTAGIACSYRLPDERLYAAAGILSLICLAALAAVSFWGAGRFGAERAFGWIMSFLCCAGGYVLCMRQDPSRAPDYFASSSCSVFVGSVEDAPHLTGNSLRLPLRVEGGWDSAASAMRPLSGKLLLYLALDSRSAGLRYGDRLLVQANPHAIEPAANPQAFCPQSHFRLQGLLHSAYVSSRHWKQMDGGGGSAWWAWMLQLRSDLLDVLQGSLSGENEYAVAAALTLGARDALSAELRNAYADTGAGHVLAVSGMHVGLMAWLCSMVLAWWKPRRRAARSLKTALLLAAVWFFVLLSGAAPSATRAGVMFTFVCCAPLLHRSGNLYNSLAAAAFVLLLVNPYQLFDVGFQFSFLAVLGIAWLEGPIYRTFYFKSRIGRWLWKMTAVSLAAQTTTAVLSLYYFHQFPLLFWLSGWLALPLAGIILPLSVLLLGAHGVPFLGDAVAWLLDTALWLLNAGIWGMSRLPGAVIEGLWLRGWEALLWNAVLALVVWALMRRALPALRCGLLLLAVLGLGRWQRVWQQSDLQQIWIYKQNKGTMVAFIDGFNALTLVDSLHADERSLHFVQQNHLWSIGILNNQIHIINKELKIKTPFVEVDYPLVQTRKGVRLAFYADTLPMDNAGVPLNVDALVLHSPARLRNVQTLEALYAPKLWIWDASNKFWLAQKWQEQADSLGLTAKSIALQGALNLE